METKAINTKLKGHARVDVADVLRGLAVMGIIILHSIEHFNFYSFPDTAGQSAWLNFSDKAIWNGLFFMFGGKAYAIFALLFGFSFFIQDDNQRLRGNDFRLRFCWRLILLFLIGNINASFFTAEVLVLYSLVGFILPLTCRLKDKWIFALACLLLIQPLPLYYVIRACLDPEFVTPAIPTRSFWNATFAVQSNGNFLETIRVNLWEGQLASLAWAWDHGRVFQTAALFLLGMLIGRKGLFLKEHLKVWNKVLAGSLVAFFPYDVPIIPNVQQLITHAQTIDIRSMYFPYLEEEEDYPLECSRIYLNTKDYPCPLVILSSNTHYDDSLLYSALAAFPPDEDGQEAKFNLLLWKEGHLYYTVVFPRSKHRPDCYFAEGSEQMLISPGALDMAGVIVTTRQEDFDKITEEKVASIIKEVGITVEEAEKIPGRYFDEKAKR